MWILFWIFGIFFYFLGATLAHELARKMLDTYHDPLEEGMCFFIAMLWPVCLAGVPFGVLWYFAHKTAHFLIKTGKNWLKTAKNG